MLPWWGSAHICPFSKSGIFELGAYTCKFRMGICFIQWKRCSILKFQFWVFYIMYSWLWFISMPKFFSLFLWASAVFIKHLTKCCHVYQDFVNCLDGILSLTLLWSFRKATLSLCCTSLVAWIWIGMTCSAGHVVMNPSKVIRCIEQIWTEPEKCCSGLT